MEQQSSNEGEIQQQGQKKKNILQKFLQQQIDSHIMDRITEYIDKKKVPNFKSAGHPSSGITLFQDLMMIGTMKDNQQNIDQDRNIVETICQTLHQKFNRKKNTLLQRITKKIPKITKEELLECIKRDLKLKFQSKKFTTLIQDQQNHEANKQSDGPSNIDSNNSLNKPAQKTILTQQTQKKIYEQTQNLVVLSSDSNHPAECFRWEPTNGLHSQNPTQAIRPVLNQELIRELQNIEENQQAISAQNVQIDICDDVQFIQWEGKYVPVKVSLLKMTPKDKSIQGQQKDKQKNTELRTTQPNIANNVDEYVQVDQQSDVIEVQVIQNTFQKAQLGKKRLNFMNQIMQGMNHQDSLQKINIDKEDEWKRDPLYAFSGRVQNFKKYDQDKVQNSQWCWDDQEDQLLGEIKDDWKNQKAVLGMLMKYKSIQNILQRLSFKGWTADSQIIDQAQRQREKMASKQIGND